MSYLNPLRLHFAGRFQASPSTVNNDPLHFDNSRFVPAFQEQQTGNSPADLNGWWNPVGDAAWRFLGCRVTSAWLGDGRAAGADDPVLAGLVADSDRKVAAKLVDLDPENQLVSQIWGLELRICDVAGTNWVEGRFEPAAFMEIWDRSTGGGGDVGAGAFYQSVLTGLRWGDVSRSPFLSELRSKASSGLLSVKFNVDGYNTDLRSGEFTRGRIVGTIGPATDDEPRHFVRGRQFMTTGLPSGNFFAPAGGINFCTAVVEPQTGKVYVDLGNALPTTKPGGDAANLGTLTLGWASPDPASPSVISLGSVPYTETGWYERTAGLVALPDGRRLSDQEMRDLAETPLMLSLTDASGTSVRAITESPGGLYVRADQFVYRLAPGEEGAVSLFATTFGRPLAGARVISIFDPNGLQQYSPLGAAPPVALPEAAINFPARVETDPNGVARLAIHAGDPGNPRGFIDGQIFGVRAALEETLAPAVSYPFSPWHFVSLLIFDSYKPEEPPTWYGSIQPLFQQYANLYPIMKRLLDLSDYESVRANRRLLQIAFSLEPTDPNSMPVTRDLSRAKRSSILRWLADDPPLMGAIESVPAPAPQPQATRGAPATSLTPTGSKALAASRRLGILAQPKETSSR